MDATTTHRTAADAITDSVPACPRCDSPMLLRAEHRRSGLPELSWACSRYPGCSGVRRITDPAEVRPYTADASVQAIFEWQRAHEQQLAVRRPGLGGRLLRARDAVAAYMSRGGVTPLDDPTMPAGRLANLIGHGFVVLDDRGHSFERAWIDHLVIGPTGIFAVDDRPWPGQLEVSDGQLFIDGRARSGVTDEVIAAAAGIGRVLHHELKPVGVTIRPVLNFEHATPAWFATSVGSVLITNGRALIRALRDDQPQLGPATVVRLALAADRLLE
jgi:hypothetical protein